MPAEHFTFQVMLRGCSRSDIKSWQVFVRTYGSLAEHLLPHRFGPAAESLRSRLPDFFASLSEDRNAFFRDFSGFNEEEFVVSFQYRLFDFFRRPVELPNPAGVSLTVVDHVFGKLPLAHQESGWLALKGYSDEVISQILRVPLSLVRAGRNMTVKGLNEFAEANTASWLLDDSLLIKVERSGVPNCPEIKSFCKVMDGRMPWQDKRNVEQHTAECRHCLNLETSLKDAVFHLRVLPPLSEAKVQSLLSLNVFARAAADSHSSILSKVLRVFR